MTIKYTNANDLEITFSGDSYILTEVNGLGGIPVDTQLQKTPFQDGVTHIDTVLKERPIDVRGVLEGTDVADLRINMLKVFNPKLSGILTYTYDDLSYMIAVKVDMPPQFPGGFPNRGPLFQKFALSLIAPDPLFYTAATVYNLSASFSVTNSGDVACPVEVIYEADGDDIVDPKITNASTSEYIELDYTLEDGEDLYVNTAFGAKEITLVSDDTNLYQYLVDGSTMFWLEPGTHTINVTVDSGTIGGELRIYNRYLGV